MNIGNIFVNTTEILYFTVNRITSIDIRINIKFKNGDFIWTRTNDNEIELLKIKITK